MRNERIAEYSMIREEYNKLEQQRVFANGEALGYTFVQAFINNISFPTTINELEYFATQVGMFNVEDILNEDTVIWTVPRWAKINDIVFFMHAKTANSIISKVRTELKKTRNCYSDEKYDLLIKWLDRGKALHNLYGGKICAIGRVSGAPEYEMSVMEEPTSFQFHWKSRVYAKISDIAVLANPVDILQFNCFIMVSRQGAITPVLGQEFERLREVIRENNTIPSYFERSSSSGILLSRITRDNWISVAGKYRGRFVLEAQFRSYYVDFLLSELGDRKTVYKECRCIKTGMPDSFVDNVILINRRYLPVEVKLSILIEQNLKAQVAKYCYDEMIKTKKRTLLPDVLYSNRVLIVDTDSVYVYDADQDSIEHIFDLDNLTDRNGVFLLRSIILKKL